MRLPRNLSGEDLCKVLKVYGYEITRQKGSHIRLTTNSPSQHHVTIPNHDPIKLGTLNSILDSVASHLNISKEHIINQLFI